MERSGAHLCLVQSLWVGEKITLDCFVSHLQLFLRVQVVWRIEVLTILSKVLGCALIFSGLCKHASVVATGCLQGSVERICTLVSPLAIYFHG